MHPSLVILDKAIELARQEFAKIELEDAAGLEESAVERARLLNTAWADKEHCNLTELGEKLSVLQNLQKQLDRAARKRFEETREELNVRKQTDRAISGYGNKIRRTMRAQVLAGNY
jgi:hypothetical protein